MDKKIQPYDSTELRDEQIRQYELGKVGRLAEKIDFEVRRIAQELADEGEYLHPDDVLEALKIVANGFVKRKG